MVSEILADEEPEGKVYSTFTFKHRHSARRNDEEVLHVSEIAHSPVCQNVAVTIIKRKIEDCLS